MAGCWFFAGYLNIREWKELTYLTINSIWLSVIFSIFSAYLFAKVSSILGYILFSGSFILFLFIAIIMAAPIRE